MLGETLRLHRLAAVLGLCLGIAGSPALGAEHTFDGVYSGKRVLTNGAASSTCPAEGKVSITIHGETLTFTDRVVKQFTEPFYPGRDGSFGETYTSVGGDTVDYHGRIVGDIIDVDVSNYAIAPCEYHWHLKKKNRAR